jgi:peptidoglycan/xylan/chitin deacetylase (PgdA/CDA1 family)
VSRALLLVYHDVRDGPRPLCVSPSLFAEHLDVLADCAANVVTVSQLARALRQGRLRDRTVCLTFDDGFASVVDEAAPRLAERGFAATVFCVAGHLGGLNDWPSQPAWVERRPLASAGRLGGLAAAGIEIGAHGFDHARLDRADGKVLRREVSDARVAIEQSVGSPVRSFAYPYGVGPPGDARPLVAQTYEAACSVCLRLADDDSDLMGLPRVDAHYVRDAERLRRVVLGRGDGFLARRRAGRRLRRLLA